VAQFAQDGVAITQGVEGKTRWCCHAAPLSEKMNRMCSLEGDSASEGRIS
jgi:hypothetical protein